MRAGTVALSAVAAFVALATATPLKAQSYPTRPVTVIVPFAGGSASDVVTRIVLDKMSAILGQPIIVDNRAGAGGNTGTYEVSRAEPDGYTLLGGGSGPAAANKTLYRSLPYDPEKDLAMISPFASFTMVIVASKTLPVKTLTELVDYAKAHPGLNYGSVGIGSSQHLAGEFFQVATGIPFTHVPYRNIAQYGPDMIAGAVPLGFVWYPNLAGAIQAKGAVPLAVAGDKRLAILPDVPTTAEAGLPGYKTAGWFGLMAPAKTPQPILEKLNAALAQAMKDPQVIERFDQQGAQPVSMSLAEAKKFQADEVKMYEDIINKAGIPKI